MNHLVPKLRDWTLFIGVALGVPIGTMWTLRASDVSRSVVFCISLLCLLGFDIYFAILLRSQKKRVGKLISRAFWCGIVVLMIFSAVVTVWAGSYVAARNSYLAIALSDKPLSDIYPERKRLVVELARKTLANSREEDKELAWAREHPLTPALYTPESFSNKSVIQSVKNQLEKAVQIDIVYSQKQEKAKAEFREKMAMVDPGYLQSWEASEARQNAEDAAIIELETNWAQATDSFYEYAADHLDEISVRNGKLVFANQGIHLSFATQEGRCITMQAKLNERVREEAQTHRKPAA